MNSKENTGIAGTVYDSQADEIKISQHALLRVIQGVAVATKSSQESITPIRELISNQKGRLSDEKSSPGDSVMTSEMSGLKSWPMSQWLEFLLYQLDDGRSRQLAILTVSVAYLRQHSRERQHVPIPSGVMAYVWSMIYGVLTHSALDPPLCSAVRSAQGFLSVALCSLIEAGNIDELFRFHVWLPDGMRGNRDFPVHSHQPFAQSWILAGEGTDLLYDVHPAQNAETATHAKYIPAWSDGKTLSSTYKTHQTISVIANTGELVCAAPDHSAVHTRDMTYTVASAQFHTSVVGDDTLHSTFFFFDSCRGFEKNASVLGPVDGVSFAQHRDPAGITAAALARIVEVVRRWETSMDHSKMCVQRGELDEAAHHCRDALLLCDSSKDLPNSASYKARTLTELEDIERQLRTKSKTWIDIPTTQLSVRVAGT